MQLLIESWMNQEVTRLSRICVTKLKKFIAEGDVPVDEPLTVEIPIHTRGKEAGILSFSVVFVSPGNPKGFRRRAGTYEPGWDNTHLIDILIARQHSIIDDGTWKKNIHAIIVDIKGILQHELEHMSQTIQGRPPDVVQVRDEDTLKGWLTYLLQPHEIEAHVVEFMRKAKMLKKPLSEVIDTAAENRVRDFRTWDNEAASAAKERILDAWRTYVKKRFPKAR